jgi:hypothetical protein
MDYFIFRKGVEYDMPQATQIVPKYLHSHVETYINDYTQFEDEASTPVDTNSKFIAVFRSSMGIDNVFVKKDDLSDFKATYGKSNYNKYGQPLMMPMAMLDSGNATVYCMRVMPDDAYAANCILSMLYKKDEITGKFTIKYRASYVDKTQFSDNSLYKTAKQFKRQLNLYAQSLKSDEPDADGFMQVPIITFRMMGRGDYGNNYRWRIARNADYETDYGIKMFSFEALSTVNGLEKVATYVGSMITSTKYNATTFINDVLDNAETGEAVMDVQVLEDNYEEVYNIYKEFVESLDPDLQDDIPDSDEWDPFFGRGVANDVLNTNLEIISENFGTDDISVDRPQGTSLSGGDDGIFGSDDEQTVYKAEVACYKSAFQGDYDKFILSPRRVPCDALLDANYPFEVKEVLADLANTRNDCLCYIDAGTETTLAQIDNIIEDMKGFNTRVLSKEFQHYTVKDATTKKKCEVTVTYYYAQNLAKHFKNNGSHVPFVKANCQLSGHVKNSLEPNVDDIDSDIKEKLYTNRINYFETIEENTYQRASQNTAQDINSDLLEENNMNTLFELKRKLERDCWNRLYDFTSAEDRARFSETEKAKFATWEGRKLDTLSITFDVNEWEAERSIVHCYVAVQFRNLNKRTIIEIDVNKRNFLG